MSGATNATSTRIARTRGSSGRAVLRTSARSSFASSSREAGTNTRKPPRYTGSTNGGHGDPYAIRTGMFSARSRAAASSASVTVPPTNATRSAVTACGRRGATSRVLRGGIREEADLRLVGGHHAERRDRDRVAGERLQTRLADETGHAVGAHRGEERRPARGERCARDRPAGGRGEKGLRTGAEVGEEERERGSDHECDEPAPPPGPRSVGAQRISSMSGVMSRWNTSWSTSGVFAYSGIRSARRCS